MTQTYTHQWETPYVVGLQRRDDLPKDTLWTARQGCGRCGTERNPLTGKITKYRGQKDEKTGRHPCQIDLEELPAYPWNKVHEHVRMSLKALQLDGRKVSFQHPDGEDSDQGSLV